MLRAMFRRLPLLFVLLASLALPASAPAARSQSVEEIRTRAEALREKQRELSRVQSQRRDAIRRLPALRAQAREAQKMADQAEETYRSLSEAASVSRAKLDRITLQYIRSVQGIGFSKAMASSGSPELSQLADASSSEDAVLVYSQGELIINQMQGKLEELRRLATEAAGRKERAESARMSAQVARQQAEASLERQRQLSELLRRTESMSRSSLRREQVELAGLFNRLLGDPDLPGIDISVLGLPTQQRITLLALREWKKGVQETPLGSNNSPDIARYRTATAGAVSGGAWCAYFVSYIARRAGKPIGAGGSGTGWVPNIADWGRQTNRFFAADDSRYKPQPGDIIVWPAHTGFVISTKGKSMTTVEGNSSDRVMRQPRAISQAVGFVRIWGSPLRGAKETGNPSAGSPSGGIL